MQLSGYIRAFDRGAPRWKEVLWILVSAFFFRTSLPWPSKVRVKLLRAFGARVVKCVFAKLNVNFRGSRWASVWIARRLILSLARVTIESHVCVSQRAFLCTGSHDFRAAHFDLITKPITNANVVGRRSVRRAQRRIGPGNGHGRCVVTANAPGVMVRGLRQSGEAMTVRDRR